jgi:epoxide hydrolase-like predicted phosphatase
MIKAIIFDFYGVICSDEYWQIVKSDRNVVSGFSKMADSVNLGTISWQDFLQDLSNKTGKPVEELKTVYEAEKIDMDLLAYIKELKKKYKTALLSNASYELFEPQAKQIGFTDFFDCTAVSSRIGVIKPDPRIYEYVLNQLGVKASEAIYIDDITRFAEAADRLGMKAIVYHNLPQLKVELDKVLSSDPDN